MKLFTIVMAGGQGTRFWPESTQKLPKQYLSLVGEEPLICQTFKRFGSMVAKDSRFVVTTQDQKELALTHAQGELLKENIIVEPMGRNTAPCIFLSMIQLIENGAKLSDVVAVVPSDHVILNEKKFREQIDIAKQVASDTSSIVTIGIPPHFPHTGFGYIHKGEPYKTFAFKVNSFVEKPDLNRAKAYLKSGEYLWNAGMFVAPIGVFMEELKAHAPILFSFFEQIKNSLTNFQELKKVYSQLPKDSIDYAVMEKSSKVMVVPAEFDWNDLGSWDALEEVIPRENGNINASSKKVYALDSQGNIVFCPGKKVALIDVKDLVIVSNGEAVLVMPKAKSQRVKEIVELIAKEL